MTLGYTYFKSRSVTDLEGMAKTDGNFIVANGTGWVAESGATARASLGVTIGTNVQAYGAALDDLSALGAPASDGQIIVATGAGAFTYESGATARTSLGLAIGTNVQAFGAVLDDLNTLGANGSDNQVLISTGAGVLAWESGATLKTSLGLTIGTNVQAYSLALDDLTSVGRVTGDSYFLVGTGANALNWETTTTVRTSMGLGTGDSPTFAGLALTADAAALTLKNSDNEHGQDEAETLIKFTDHTGAILAQIQGHHENTADDTKGGWALSTHTGSVLTEAIRVDENQNIGFGIAPEEMCHFARSDYNFIALDCYSTTTTDQMNLILRRSHHNTIGTKIQTVDNDELGSIIFHGVDDSNNFDEGARIKAVQNGTCGSFIPTDLIFDTFSSYGQNANQLILCTNGGVGVKVPTPQGSFSIGNSTEGGTASLNIQTAHETHTLTLGASSVTTTIDIPTGAKVIGASFCVNTAVTDSAGDDSWTAAFSGGDTSSLGGGAAAQNTKVDTLVEGKITSGETNITFTPNGGNFSAGVIEVVAYYYDLTSLANV